MLKKKGLVFLLVGLLVFSLFGCGQKEQSSGDAADIIVTNAYVYTVDEEATTAEAVAVKDGKIIFVGSSEEAEKLKGEKSQVIDLKGGTVIPGLMDSHMHPAMSAVSWHFGITLPEDVMNLEAYKEIIAEFVKEHPDQEVYVGSGYQRSLFDQVGPRKEILDEICSDKPVILTSADGHSEWVNSKAMELAGITKDTPDPEGGIIQRDPQTQGPAGLLQDSATQLVADLKPEYTVEQYKEAVTWLQGWLNSKGITSVFDAMIPTDEENYYTAYEEMAEAGELTLRVRGGWHMYPELGDQEELLQIAEDAIAKSKEFKTAYFQVNAFKFFADQVLEEQTAYLSQPYTNREDGYQGIKVWDEETLEAVFKYIDKNGYQIHAHQIGDEAATYVLDVLEKVEQENGKHDARHALAHIQLMKEQDMQRMKALGMTAVVAPYWTVIDDYYWNLYMPYLGEERVNNMYPCQSLVDAELNVAFHSDFFVTEPDFGFLFYSAQTRTLPQRVFENWYEGEDLKRTTDYNEPLEKGDIGPLQQANERLTLEESLKAATYNGAYANFMEKENGSIEKGKAADLVLLKENIFETDIEALANITPYITIFDGKIVYDQEKDKKSSDDE